MSAILGGLGGSLLLGIDAASRSGIGQLVMGLTTGPSGASSYSVTTPLP